MLVKNYFNFQQNSAWNTEKIELFLEWKNKKVNQQKKFVFQVTKIFFKFYFDFKIFINDLHFHSLSKEEKLCASFQMEKTSKNISSFV